LIPPVATRLRRDFSHVLGLIEAHAILHQESRSRDEAGRIVSNLRDYAEVRRLIADIISDGLGATVPRTVRETAEAVRQLVAGGAREEVSVAQLAQHFKLDPSTVKRRVYTAISLGYVENLANKGKPLRLVPGEPLPKELEILPDVTQLGEVVQACTEDV